MIFYFSGQFPSSRKDFPDDKELQFFKDRQQPFDRLICITYGKDADQVLKNVQLMEEQNGNRKSKRVSRTRCAVPGYPKYAVLINGDIYSRGYLLRPQTQRDGYQYVDLVNENGKKRVAVHRIVCESFHGSPIGKRNVVNHKDGNRLNNHRDNLEWCTHKENYEHAVAMGLGAPIDEIGRRYSKPIVARTMQGVVYRCYASISEAERDGHFKKEVQKCLAGKRKSYHELIWAYDKESTNDNSE